MNLLSLLVCLAMLFSGGSMSEDPQAATATQLTLHDVVISYQGEVYPLSPSVTLGAATENGTAILDFSMPLGDDILFPVQAKIDDQGLALMMGKSAMAYTLTPECLDLLTEGAEIPEEIPSMMESYAALMRASTDAQNMTFDPELNARMTEQIMALANDLVTEAAEFTIDGETYSGERSVFTLDHEDMIEYMDIALASVPGEFTEAYFDYLNATMALTGMPEMNSFGDLMTMSGMKMSMDFDVTGDEDRSVGEIVMHITVDPSAMMAADPASVGIIGGADGPTSIMVTAVTEEAYADVTEEPADVEMETTEDTAEIKAQMATEPVTIDLPMQIITRSLANQQVEVIMDTEIEGVPMFMSASTEGKNIRASFTMEIPEESVSVAVEMVTAPDADGNTKSSTSMTMGDGTFNFSFLSAGTTTEAGSTTLYDFKGSEPDFDFGVRFVADVTHNAIADRSIDAQRVMIPSLEDSEAVTSLSMAAMGMMGDAEKLMNDESIRAIVELFTVAYEDVDVGVSVVETAENTEEPMPIPEFGWLPEGYTLNEDETYAYSTFVNLYFYDDEYNLIAVYASDPISAYGESVETCYYAVQDGEIQPIEGTGIQIDRIHSESYSSVEGAIQLGNREVTLSSDGDLTDEDVIKILTSITFPETETAE